MPLLIIVKMLGEPFWGDVESAESVQGEEGGLRTGDVGSWDVTLGCAANSAGTFFCTAQWIQDTHTHTQFLAPSLLVIYTSKPASLGVK